MVEAFNRPTRRVALVRIGTGVEDVFLDHQGVGKGQFDDRGATAEARVGPFCVRATVHEVRGDLVRVQSHVVASGVAGLEARDFPVVVIVELNLAGRRAGGNVDGLGAVWMGGGWCGWACDCGYEGRAG